MAATAAVGRSFSPSLHTLKCTQINQYPCGSLLKISAPFRIVVAALSRSYCIEPVSVVSAPWRLMHRVSAAVAQEETATAESAEEEQAIGVEGEGEGGDQLVEPRLYFGNLPFSVDSAELAAIVQHYRTPELVEVLYNKYRRSRGYGFVTMSSIEDCNAVIENLDGSECKGRILRVKPLYPETKHKLYVMNLSKSITSESLAKKFQEYGNVVGASVICNGGTGRSCGYGFVCYSKRSELEASLENLNGVEVEGRTIHIKLAQGTKSLEEL